MRVDTEPSDSDASDIARVYLIILWALLLPFYFVFSYPYSQSFHNHRYCLINALFTLSHSPSPTYESLLLFHHFLFYPIVKYVYNTLYSRRRRLVNPLRVFRSSIPSRASRQVMGPEPAR